MRLESDHFRPRHQGRSLWKAIALLLAGSACTSDDPIDPGTQSLVPVRIVIDMGSPRLEPLFDSVRLTARVYAAGGRLITGQEVTWTSLDPSIAEICGVSLCPLRPGVVTLVASIGSLYAETTVEVAWRPGTTITVFTEGHLSVVPETDVVSLRAAIRDRPLSVREVSWSTSDPAIATVDAGGMMTTLSPGDVVITARFRGLEQRLPIRVIGRDPAESGFGYAFAGDGVPHLEDYEDVIAWRPPAGLYYSTVGGDGMIRFLPPYASAVDFGWLRTGVSRDSALLHAVALIRAPCVAAIRTEFSPGTTFQCRVGMFQDRFEAIAATPNAFDGTVAMVRPGLANITTTGMGFRTHLVDAATLEYDVPGFTRGSMYWFTTPSRDRGACAIAPARSTSASVAVTCRDLLGRAALVTHNAMGFATDASRDGEPRVFAELDTAGTVIRSAEAGLTIATVRKAGAAFLIRLSGPRVATFTRVPAILLSAVSPHGGATCWITQPRLAGGAVELEVTCEGAEGVMFGATY
jgi:hypothetical protein